MPIDVVACQTGAARYEGLAVGVTGRGAAFSTAECFDRCETCERALLARLDGTLMRFSTVAELVDALDTLAAG